MRGSWPIFEMIRRFLAALTAWDWLPRLLVRLVVGVMFCGSGWNKLHEVGEFGDWFAKLGIPFPHLNAVFVAALEFVGGAALVVGVGTRGFAVLLAGTMVVALWTVVGETAKTLGEFLYKSETLLTVILVWLAFTGPGPLSGDHVVSRRLGVADRPRRSDRA